MELAVRQSWPGGPVDLGLGLGLGLGFELRWLGLGLGLRLGLGLPCGGTVDAHDRLGLGLGLGLPFGSPGPVGPYTCTRGMEVILHIAHSGRAAVYSIS